MNNSNKQGDPAVRTKKSETVIRSLNPRELLNKFLTKNLTRTWTEDFLDSDTRQIISVKRSEIILQKGTCLNPDNMQKVLFHLQTNDITEPIEVSNQCRLGSEVEYPRFPYMCKAETDGTSYKLLMLAKGVQQALDIAKDWCELNFRRSFAISEVKAYDCAVILVDRLRQYSADEAAKRYSEGEIAFEEFMDEEVEDKDLDKQEGGDMLKFYQIKAAVTKDGERMDGTSLFVVLAADADRAILTINAYLQQKQKEHNRRMVEQNREEEVDEKEITASIEESKIVSFSRLIPDNFCRAYYSEEA